MIDKSCIRKIGVFRVLQLGDLMCSIPAIRALRKEFRDAEIFLIGLPNSKDFVHRFPNYFNGLIKFPGYPGLPEQPYDKVEIVNFIELMQKQKFDLILQMQGNGNIVNPLMELLGSHYTAGFYREKDYIPGGGLFIPYPGGHEAERHLKLIEHLGIESRGAYLEFPLYPKDYEDFTNSDIPVKKGEYVCIHPGSRGAWRQWDTANFARIADYCYERGKEIVITGTKDELPLAEEVAMYMNHKPIIATGKTTLGALGVLVKEAFALVSNCTGISHIASALNTPGIIISMDGEPERWGPLNKEVLTTIDWLSFPDFHQAELAVNKLFENRKENLAIN